MQSKETKAINEYEGSCLCGETSYMAKGKPINPHLCSCTMCQKSSGSLTVPWVGFELKDFSWTKNEPRLYRSSKTTDRISCKNCGGLLGTLNYEKDGKLKSEIWITIGTLKNPHLIIPENQHSYKESAPSWWISKII